MKLKELHEALDNQAINNSFQKVKEIYRKTFPNTVVSGTSASDGYYYIHIIDAKPDRIKINQLPTIRGWRVTRFLPMPTLNYQEPHPTKAWDYSVKMIHHSANPEDMPRADSYGKYGAQYLGRAPFKPLGYKAPQHIAQSKTPQTKNLDQLTKHAHDVALYKARTQATKRKQDN